VGARASAASAEAAEAASPRASAPGADILTPRALRGARLSLWRASSYARFEPSEEPSNFQVVFRAHSASARLAFPSSSRARTARPVEQVSDRYV
jgi:hypothetical protein